jgi:CheY-like chemotaxis protein
MFILCAEDDHDIRSLILKLLRADGHTVLAAGDGEAALELSRNCPDTIDVLLSDVEMPKMNGLELWKHLLAERPRIKVLMMSGACGPSQKAVAGLPILQIPFNRMALRNSIQSVLD